MTILLRWPSLYKRFVDIRDRVAQLQPIQFRYHKDIDPEQKLRAGFSAQQVAQVFPDAVIKQNGYLFINKAKLNGYIQQAQNS